MLFFRLCHGSAKASWLWFRSLTPALSQRERGLFGAGGEFDVVLKRLIIPPPPSRAKERVGRITVRGYLPLAVPPGRSAWLVRPIADGVRSYARASLNHRSNCLAGRAEVLFVGWVEPAKPMRWR